MLLPCLRQRASLFTGTLNNTRSGSPKDFKRSFVADAVRFQTSNVVPLRKQLKDEAKAKKFASLETKGKAKRQDIDPRLKNWELTVGVEIHAQLNTTRKLFSCTRKADEKRSVRLTEQHSCIYVPQCATEPACSSIRPVRPRQPPRVPEGDVDPSTTRGNRFKLLHTTCQPV
jgi:hypothetical protein